MQDHSLSTWVGGCGGRRDDGRLAQQGGHAGQQLPPLAEQRAAQAWQHEQHHAAQQRLRLHVVEAASAALSTVQRTKTPSQKKFCAMFGHARQRKKATCSTAIPLMKTHNVRKDGSSLLRSQDYPPDVLERITRSPDAIRQRPEQQLLHVRQPYRAGRLHRDLCASLHSMQCAGLRHDGGAAAAR